MIWYIPTSNEIVFETWYCGGSFLFSKDGCERGSLTVDLMNSFGWKEIGVL